VYARLTTIVFASEEQDPAPSVFERIVPVIEELDGFQEIVMLSGLDDRSLVALTLWQTEAALEAAQPVLEGIKRAETSHRSVETRQTSRFVVAGRRLAS
jgi:heme-degrading monooxygenase HmoA